MRRRDFLATLSIACANGLSLRHALAADSPLFGGLYDIPAPPAGSLSVLHFTDSHAQLQPLWFREAAAPAPGSAFAPGSARAYAFGKLNFSEAARRFGKVGGFAHLATLVQQVRATRPQSLLVDGGDSWQGSALALWTGGRDMVAASRALGVDCMTGHWEFTQGAGRVREIVDHELGSRIAFLAHNVQSREFGDPVFQAWTLREQHGIPYAIIGQAYPYTPIAHPARFTPDWTFGIQEAALQGHIDAARRAGAQAVVLLSHNGLDIDLKLAGRVHGLDAILGGHTHDPLATPVLVSAQGGGQTLVSNAGSHGKFLAVLDLTVRDRRVQGFQYRLLPVFAEALPADPAMQALIDRHRAPYAAKLDAPLAHSDGLLYRRSTFGGSFDQLIVDALMEVKDAPIAFSPGFRWGGCVLPGDTLTREDLMNQTAISYPATTVRSLTGMEIKAVLEDVADNLFNPDPYYRQGGDMVRVGGLRYRCVTKAGFGARILDLQLNGEALKPDRRYRVAGWAALAESASDGPPVWEVVEEWLRAHHRVPTLAPTMAEPGPQA